MIGGGVRVRPHPARAGGGLADRLRCALLLIALLAPLPVRAESAAPSTSPDAPALLDLGPAPGTPAAPPSAPGTASSLAASADGASSLPTDPTEPARVSGVSGPAAPLIALGPSPRRPSPVGEAEPSFLGRLMGLVGCLAMMGLAALASTDRRRISWRLVATGTAIQFLFAWLVLKTPLGQGIFSLANDGVKKLLSFSTTGARFVFGNLVESRLPVLGPGGEPTAMVADAGAFIAFNLMPTILFFSALSAILYHLGVLQLVVRALAFFMRRAMGTSGAESLSAAGNIFLGQTEAPLLVRPFLERMTPSELMAVMTGGFATVAGGVLAIYVGFLEGSFPDIAGHLVAASVMSAPASLVMAKLMVPETEVPVTSVAAAIHVEVQDANVLDAAARGISEGLKLALNVAAMLIGFMALLPLLNWMLTWPSVPLAALGADGAASFFADLRLETILGFLLAPLAFVLGVPWADAPQIGAMMGAKTVINEFVAYLQLKEAVEAGTLTHTKSVVIATYALCGFSNLGSIGIQIGGLGVMAPSRRKDLARLGLRAMVAASLACFQTAALAGMLL